MHNGVNALKVFHSSLMLLSVFQRLNQCNDEALASLHLRPTEPGKPPRLAEICVLAFDIVNNSRHCFDLVLKVKMDEGTSPFSRFPLTRSASLDFVG